MRQEHATLPRRERSAGGRAGDTGSRFWGHYELFLQSPSKSSLTSKQEAKNSAAPQEAQPGGPTRPACCTQGGGEGKRGLLQEAPFGI